VNAYVALVSILFVCGLSVSSGTAPRHGIGKERDLHVRAHRRVGLVRCGVLVGVLALVLLVPHGVWALNFLLADQYVNAVWKECMQYPSYLGCGDCAPCFAAPELVDTAARKRRVCQVVWKRLFDSSIR
jgi:hypothetical protein